MEAVKFDKAPRRHHQKMEAVEWRHYQKIAAAKFDDLDTRLSGLRWARWASDSWDGARQLRFPTGPRFLVPDCCLAGSELQINGAALAWFAELLRSLGHSMLLFAKPQIRSSVRVSKLEIVDCEGFALRAEHLGRGPLTVTCEVWARVSARAGPRLCEARSLILVPCRIQGDSYYRDSVNLLMRGLDHRGIRLPTDFYSRLYYITHQTLRRQCTQ